MARTTEAEIGIAALRLLNAQPSGQASIAEVKHQLPDLVNLSGEDQVKSITRPNEEMWEQQVRNLVSHRGASGNIFTEGYAEYVKKKYIRITDTGREFLKRKGY